MYEMPRIMNVAEATMGCIRIKASKTARSSTTELIKVKKGKITPKTTLFTLWVTVAIISLLF
jgi:hypothetical protein